MFVIFLLLVMMASTTFASESNAMIKFGCKYMDKYKLDSNNLNLQEPQYSEPRPRMNFSDIDELKKMYNTLTDLMLEQRTEMLYNSVDPFLTMIKAYNKNNGDFSEFYKNYVPTFPPLQIGGDSITALFAVYNRYISKEPRVDSFFVMGSLNQNTNQSFAETCIKQAKGEHPPSTFQTDKIVGIIPFSLENKKGVFLLDMMDYKNPIPIVMENPNHELNTKTSVTYDLFSNMYKTTFTYSEDYIIMNNTLKGENEDPDIDNWMDILYTSRSLCSFVQSTVKQFLLKPFLHIARYSSLSDKDVLPSTAEAIVILETCEVQLYSHKLTDVSKYSDIVQTSRYENIGYRNIVILNLTEIYNKNISKLEEDYIKEVETGLKLHEGVLRMKLETLSAICVAKNWKNTIAQSNLNNEEKIWSPFVLTKKFGKYLSAKIFSCFNSKDTIET